MSRALLVCASSQILDRMTAIRCRRNSRRDCYCFRPQNGTRAGDRSSLTRTPKPGSATRGTCFFSVCAMSRAAAVRPGKTWSVSWLLDFRALAWCRTFECEKYRAITTLARSRSATCCESWHSLASSVHKSRVSSLRNARGSEARPWPGFASVIVTSLHRQKRVFLKDSSLKQLHLA